jgi:acylphosphatase
MRGGELLELRAIVKGKVHHIGFRATAREYALQLKLTGFVRNLADGSVELRSQGERSHLEQLLEKLRQRFGSYIQNIDYEFHPSSQVYSDFKIIH